MAMFHDGTAQCKLDSAKEQCDLNQQLEIAYIALRLFHRMKYGTTGRMNHNK